MKIQDEYGDIVLATTLLNDLFEEKINFDEFLHQYDNFYYRLGMDELSYSQKDCICKYIEIIDIHKKRPTITLVFFLILSFRKH